MDALKLNLRAKDQLHPLLTEVMAGYSKFKGSAEWEGRGKIIHWCVQLGVGMLVPVLVLTSKAHYTQRHEGRRRDHGGAVPPDAVRH
jgi:hypothetical protein